MHVTPIKSNLTVTLSNFLAGHATACTWGSEAAVLAIKPNGMRAFAQVVTCKPAVLLDS